MQGVLVMATGGWVLIVVPKLNASTRGIVARLALSVWRYALTWAAVWAVLWWQAPTLLVGSRAGAQTVLQVLPAVIVAVLVLALGSLFVIAQTAVGTWGTRSPAMLTLDEDIAMSVSRPLVLAVAALLVAGQVPDAGNPPAALTAAIAALMFAAARLILTVTVITPSVLQRYTLPRGFPQHVVEERDLGRELDAGELGYVVFRGPLLGEMARLAVRRGDSVALGATLEAIDQLHAVVLAATETQPELRTFVTDEGAAREGWLADDLSRALVAVADEALRSNATGDDLNAVSATLAKLADGFMRAGDGGSAQTCVRGLAEMGTSHLQVTAHSTNVNSEPVGQLAWLEAQAEACGDPDTAADTLASWALCAAYVRFHLGASQHPLQPRSIHAFGPSPPWAGALRLIMDDEVGWLRPWANKVGDNVQEVVTEVLRAADEHAELHGLPKPDLLASVRSQRSHRGRRHR